MLLKRSIVLVGGLLAFVIGFIILFDVNDAEMEKGFRQERQQFGVDGKVLTTSTIKDTASSANVSAAASPAPTSAPAASTTPDTSASATSPAVAPAPSDASTPSPAPTPDPSVIIGPLPPSGTVPESPAPTPTPSDPNAAPMQPSTMLLPRGMNQLGSLLLGAYGLGPRVQMPNTDMPPAGTTPTPSLPATPSPSTSPSPTPSGASTAPNATTGTNAAPYALSTGESGAPRPVPVEASVIVLGYHQFTGPGVPSKNIYSMKQDVFEQEMKYLHDNGYHVVPLSDVVKFVKHEIGLPPNSVAITIDDGYKSAIVYAAPVLKKYGYPWTYFVYPQFITPHESKGAASWDDLLALQADGVDIESHSMTHPILTKKGGKSPEEYTKWLTNETAGSKELLEKKLGKPISYLAYPYGEYNKVVEQSAIDAGYDAIFTVANNPVHSSTNKFSIGRYIITLPVEKAFASFLHQGALSVANAEPAPGSTISNPRPVISAVLGYAGNLDPKSIETDVRDFGAVRHDFDPVTSTIRLYLPRDLIQPTNSVNIRVKDADTGQTMVANWHFNYEAGGIAAAHAPISSTNAAPEASAKPTPAREKETAPAPSGEGESGESSAAKASTKN